jgi:hypothetical protein
MVFLPILLIPPKLEPIVEEGVNVSKRYMVTLVAAYRRHVPLVVVG